MRALVAEGNVVTRVTLRRLLERSDFEVEELRDELAAACLLYQPDPPDLAVLSLDTLLVDFGQVCAAMRHAKPEVFIVALVPEARRSDLANVLDAGADDFLIKPATIQEAEARLRVILRTLQAVGGSLLPDTGDVPRGDEELPTPTRQFRLSRFLDELDLPQSLTTLFGQFGLQPIREIDAEAAVENPHYAAWVPMLLRQNERAQWLNVRMTLDRANAERLFDAVHRKVAFTEPALFHTLTEILGLAQDGLRAAMLQYVDAEVYVPIAPIPLAAADLPSPQALVSPHAKQRYLGLSLGQDLRVHLSLTMEPVPLAEREIGNLRRLDVLAAPIESDEYHTVLLGPGTMLDDSYIDRVQALTSAKNLSRKVGVFPPPMGTASFLRQLIESGQGLVDAKG